MVNQEWFSALLILVCSSPGILRQPPLLARERETFGIFSVHVRLVVLELASEEVFKKKENDDFRFFQNSFISFYKAELKSEEGKGFQ